MTGRQVQQLFRFFFPAKTRGDGGRGGLGLGPLICLGNSRVPLSRGKFLISSLWTLVLGRPRERQRGEGESGGAHIF